MPRFEKGNSFGEGRQKGSRNKATLLLDEIGSDGAADLIQMVKGKAADGDLRAAAILLARLWPSGRDRPVALDLPPIETALDISRAHAAVVAQLAAGEITPDEANRVSDVLENQRRIFETSDLEKRLQAVEAMTRNLQRPPRAA
jgi:hypothetical protein